MSVICPTSTVTHLTWAILDEPRLLELPKAMTTINSCCAFIQQCTRSTQQYSVEYSWYALESGATNSPTKLHWHRRQILASFQLCLKLYSLGFHVQWRSRVCNAPLGPSQTIKNGLRICRIWSHIWSTLGSWQIKIIDRYGVVTLWCNAVPQSIQQSIDVGQNSPKDPYLYRPKKMVTPQFDAIRTWLMSCYEQKHREDLGNVNKIRCLQQGKVLQEAPCKSSCQETVASLSAKVPSVSDAQGFIKAAVSAFWTCQQLSEAVKLCQPRYQVD